MQPGPPVLGNGPPPLAQRTLQAKHRLGVGVLVAQLCLAICNPMDCSLPGSSSMGFSRQEHWQKVIEELGQSD